MFKKSLSLISPLLCLTLPVFAYEHDQQGQLDFETWGDDSQIVLTVTGGLAFVDASLSDAFDLGTTHFNYQSSSSNDAQALLGAFVGFEKILSPDWNGQLGLSYYWTQTDANGDVTQGIVSETPSTFPYSYDFTSQQVLAEGRLIWKADEIWRPYVTLGLGVSINRADSYTVMIPGEPPMTLSPTLSDNTQTSFSYMLGLGIDAQLDERIRMGLGYRYANFGDFGFEDGVMQDDTPVEANLTSSAHANEIFAQFSYLFAL